MIGIVIIPATLFFSLLVTLFLYLTWHFDHWTKRGIPGPRPVPLYGTFPCTVTGKRNIIYDMDDIYRKFKQKAKFVGVFMTRNPQILILDPQTVKEILITNFKCFQDNESSKWMNKDIEPISGGNPFVLCNSEWKIKRTEMTAGLSMLKIKAMYPIIMQTCKKLTQYLKAHLEKETNGVEAKDFSLKFTGEVVADVVWGIEAGTFNTQNDEECNFLKMSKKMILQTFNAFSYFFIIGLFPIIRRLYTVRFFPLLTDNFFLELTAKAIKLRTEGDGQRQDFLQHLIELQQKKNLTNTDVVALMLTFHFDGFETSATLISHCLLLLGRNQNCQDILRQEIKSNMNEEGCMSVDELMNLPYLDQCISETLRIFVPLAFMSKMCTEPCELKNSNGTRLQMNIGDICLVSIYSLHHDDNYYPQPESFIPERFSEENGGAKKYKDMGVYLPFGDGPRICLGMKFGLAQAKAAVVEVIKNFKVTVNEKTRTDNYQNSYGFIVNLEGGIYLNLKPI